MARNYSKIILIGTIESDISLRSTNNQTSVTNFTLTTFDEWIDKSGKTQTHKKWHHVVCWGKLAEQTVKNFKIGDVVIVEGSISYRYYEKDNNQVKVAEIKAKTVSLWTGSFNKIILVGNVGNDPELRNTLNGTAVTNFSLSTIDRWKDKDGVTKYHKKWHKTVCWGKTAEVAVNNIKNGSLVLLEGSLAYKTFVNKDGIKNNHIAEIKTSQLEKWSNPITSTIKTEDI
ncbi:single-stranded DNA-binding protein [archaeon]|jgi:single-strand DNA-binding protein|nr:single-stranded DNA-binding protein [archaeon]